MSWVTKWFKSSQAKAIESAAKAVLKVFVGRFADTVWDATKNEVDKAEATGLPGEEKWQIAFDGLKAALPMIGKAVLNFAIEIAVLYFKAKVKVA